MRKRNLRAVRNGAGGEGAKSADTAIADVGGQRRVKDLGGLEAEGLNSVEETLARTEQDGRDVEGELVDNAGDQRLSHDRSPTGDVHTALTGSLTCCGVGRVEALSDEVERRPPVHLDRLMAVMGQHENRRVIGRFGAPPAGPFLVPAPADRAEHVPTRSAGAGTRNGPAGGAPNLPITRRFSC